MIKDLLKLKKKIVPVLKRNDVEFAGIFGSYARGNTRKGSDIDLIVRFGRPKSLYDLIGLERKLSRFLGARVDLGTESGIHPHIKSQIKKDLKVIYGQRRTL